jgi:hypothetical protein
MPLPPPLLLLPTTDCCCCCNLRNELREEEAQLLSKNLNPDQSPAAAPAATQEAAAPPTKAAIAKKTKTTEIPSPSHKTCPQTRRPPPPQKTTLTKKTNPVLKSLHQKFAPEKFCLCDPVRNEYQKKKRKKSLRDPSTKIPLAKIISPQNARHKVALVSVSLSRARSLPLDALTQTHSHLAAGSYPRLNLDS